MKRILSIIRKDLIQIFRNRFIAVISFLAIFLYALVYYLMPSKVDEVFKLGFYLKVDAQAAEQLRLAGGKKAIEKRLTEDGEEGVKIVWADSLEELKRLVRENDVQAGVYLDLSSEKPNVVLYVSSKTPVEVSDAGEMIAREIGYTFLGFQLPVEYETTVIGPDMVGRQIPARDKARILFLSFVLLLELYGLGNLIVEEVQKKTAQAVLVTPVSLKEFISAKAATGILMAFFQGLLVAFLLNALSRETWLPVTIFLFLGASLIVGVAFLIGAVSRDFMSMVMISLIPFIILTFPAFVIIDPGLSSPIIKAIPTYYLLQPLDGILNYRFPFSNYYPSILYLLLFCFAFFILGFWTLKRRLA
jgi:ABC-type multidrug transport system fused ATPase/permease subunit